ncbi:MAG TPA: aminopeptidase P family N-terminal domain-containing protein [Hyphomicrobiales bacterium]|nr:aminopeptidase P family N-terminal domain-containing protein [Hyphomicrobiales bacterium]
MKRGLVTLDDAESAASVFMQRLDRFRDGLRAAKLDVALIYGDVSRSAGMDYLTNFCLYWNESVLVVPVHGAPALIMKLSKRVQPWIRNTTVLDDIHSGQNLVQNIAVHLRERWLGGDMHVAINDMAWWPAEVLDGLRAMLPRATFVDTPGAIAALREIPDDAERALLRRAGSLLGEALACAWTEGATPEQWTEIAVREARLRGFLDFHMHCRKLHDGSAYIDAVAQYRYVWLRLCRPRGGATAVLTNTLMTQLLAAVQPGVTEQGLALQVADWMYVGYRHAFSCIRQTEIETGGDYRQEGDATRPLREGEVVSLKLSLFRDGEEVHAAETVIVTNTGVDSLVAR